MIRKIRKAAVIGSGIMGGGIAALLAGAGVNVQLLDIVPFDLKEDEKTDPAARNRIVNAGLEASLASSPALFFNKKDAGRIKTGNLEDDIQNISECDWIIEVVVENLGIKRDLFAKIEKLRKPGSIVSSNTSGIPLKDICKGFSKEFKRHFMGTHFFNPVRYMHLLELIPGADTLPEILDFIAAFGEKNLGKGIVWAKDTPNFVGNRIGIQEIGAIMNAMEEDGLTIAEVDAIFGPALGRPKTAIFRLADLVGLDTIVHVCKNSYDLCPDDEQREALLLPGFVEKMVDKNLLGNKTGAGFYKTELTPEWKKIRKILNPSTMEYQDLVRPTFPCIDAAKKKETLKEKIDCVLNGDDKGAKFAWKMATNSFLYAANRVPEIADTIVEIDNAMKWGYNFEMGPFELWDAYGVQAAVERMEKQDLKVPAHIKGMLEKGNTCFYKLERGIQYYYDFVSDAYKPVPAGKNMVSIAAAKGNRKTVMENNSASLVDIGDDVFCIEFHTKMNALNEEIVDLMGDALDYVDKNGAGLVIGNEAGGVPGAFSAGADLAFISRLCHEKKYAEIDVFLKKAQAGVQRIKYAAFPVVAAPYGMVLGGGCEICLGADRIVAHAELYMGLVEIGVGLLPAGGGTMNLWKKYITALPAKTAKDTDLAKFFVPAFMNIAMASVSMSAAQARGNGFLGQADRIVFNRDNLIGEAKKEVLKMVDDGYIPPARQPLIVMGDAGQGMVNAEIFNLLNGKFMSEHDAFLARRIAYVMGGGDVKTGSTVDEDTILKLERDAFADFCKQEKTIARIDHMLKTGKPLRN
ncbi:3-hydroxyacyl-CoA dehydrogenase/enoyl-CoA hydratase family protein [Desulfobacula toluolica]|uniref:FadB: 3-hydroxyacyl-CoA dehydrogenase, NAD-binding n=1 Tax=Desulfobacula toluolica (strain DSM 7467 / Tol2) TaxID=651182 RepID=K0NF73_DESTT|nr:3-hydroxyacyl-CoA dehydrogenase/enoyl-CoA hydratase family protein [Desulfobacula toluolica]CCK78338.1 FadB: 3-hydroxyacyl-CoA dehydrogenase, NAD-binding [Desulfobacula toluolica Tol2]